MQFVWALLLLGLLLSLVTQGLQGLSEAWRSNPLLVMTAVAVPLMWLKIYQMWVAERPPRPPPVHPKTLFELRVLTPREFEEAVAALLLAEGYTRVRVTGRSGDLQADIIATSPAPAQVKTVVQCKRYGKAKVTSPQMQSFIGMAYRHHGARGIYATTSTFTKPARQLGRQHGIELLDGPALVAGMRRANRRATTPS